LLTRPGRVVSVDALVQGLWADDPPRSADKTLQSYVVHLRRALEPDRPRGAAGMVLVTREPGYLLRVAPGELDATRFADLTAQGRRLLAAGAAEAAAATLREALGLWRGEAFEEFPRSTPAPPKPRGWRSCGWVRSRSGWRRTWRWDATESCSASWRA
jgi:DNA-binding SARP family transcriptional activator